MQLLAKEIRKTEKIVCKRNNILCFLTIEIYYISCLMSLEWIGLNIPHQETK
jgi:hypothetical protein